MARLIVTELLCSSPFIWLRTMIDSRASISSSLLQIRPLYAKPAPNSPFESNTIRILGTEIECQCDYAPPRQFKMGQGDQQTTMRRKFGGNEDIKIEETMFDGFEHVPKLGDDGSGVDVRLHISLLVDISKGEGGDELEFVCSSWPDSLEVQKVYVLCDGCWLGLTRDLISGIRMPRFKRNLVNT